ncbi:MAG: DNA-3-methyladenine glycosylase [Acidobacteria bacterium]|nr:DNA-3-methyladenine glycosylase [Acidobacteriota bacterium]
MGHSDLPLGRAFYQCPTAEVAEELLGKIIIRECSEGRVAVRLTEVEAYLGPNDPACHTFGGRRTPRIESMWGEAGRAYVYQIYGMHHCLNVVTVGGGAGEAVLLRAAIIVSGGPLIRQRRGPRPSDRNLVNGPGKLCQALAIDRTADGCDLSSTEFGLWIEDDGFVVPAERVKTGPRIGLGDVGEAARWPLRYFYQE